MIDWNDAREAELLLVREEWYSAICQSEVLRNHWEDASLSMLMMPTKMTKMTLAIQLRPFGLAKSPADTEN